MEEVTCLICNQTGIPKLVLNVSDINLIKTYPIVKCRSCGVIKSMGIPEDLAVFYAGGMYRSSEKRSILRFLKRYLHRMEVRRLMKASVSKLFIDVGCGSGNFSQYLHESGYSVVTADAAASRPCDIAASPDIPYLIFDYNAYTVENPELLKGRTVILRHVLEHIRDPRKILQQFAYNGASYFYILVPNSSGLSKKIFGKYEGLWGLPYHLWHFDRKSLETLCESAGLKVLKSGYETIPVFLYSFHRFLVAGGAPKFIQRIFKPDLLRLILSFPFDIFSIHNVVYVIAKVELKACQQA